VSHTFHMTPALRSESDPQRFPHPPFPFTRHSEGVFGNSKEFSSPRGTRTSVQVPRTLGAPANECRPPVDEEAELERSRQEEYRKKIHHERAMMAAREARHDFEYAQEQASRAAAARLARRAIQVVRARENFAFVLITKAYELDDFIESDRPFFIRRRNYLESVGRWHDGDSEAVELGDWYEQVEAKAARTRTMESHYFRAATTASDKEEFDDTARTAQAALDIMAWYHDAKAAKAARTKDASDTVASAASTPAKPEFDAPDTPPGDSVEPITLFECVFAPLDITLEQQPHQESASPPQESPQESPSPPHEQTLPPSRQEMPPPVPAGTSQFGTFTSSPSYVPLAMNKYRVQTLDDFLSPIVLPIHAAPSTGRNRLALSCNRDEDRKHKTHHPGGYPTVCGSFFFAAGFLTPILLVCHLYFHW
jgi:hypothetical protein